MAKLFSSRSAFYEDGNDQLSNQTVVSEQNSSSTSDHYVHVYIGLLVALMLVSSLQCITYACFTRLASINLHNKMFRIVMRAPMSFFEKNPVGQVLNRFTRDLGFVDDPLPNTSHLLLIVRLLSRITGLL